MHVSVTLRVVPHQKRERLRADELRQEANRLMEGLAEANRVGGVEDVSVESDADTGLVKVEAIVVARNNQSAIDAFTAYFWAVADGGSPGSTVGPVSHVILEKRAAPLEHLPEQTRVPEHRKAVED